MYLNDYKEFAEQNGFTDKLNQIINNENISTFLNQRLEGLKHSIQENYIRGLNSMLKGLQEANIGIPCQSYVFDNKVAEIKDTALLTQEPGLPLSPHQIRLNSFKA